MSVQPREILDVAKSLAETPKGEACYRSVINRAYYAAYNGAKRFHGNLATPGTVVNANGSHEQLISALDNPTIPRSPEYWTSKGISKTLRLAFAARVNADYYLNTSCTADTALGTLGQSEEILNRIGL